MLKRRSKAVSTLGAPLGLRSADNTLQQAFDTDIVNSFRQMVTELSYKGELPQRIALISALHGEGVTYTSLALGTILASDLETRVCVVELNWWSPGMLRQLDPSSGAPVKRWRGRRGAPTPASAPAVSYPGLAQVLTGEASLDDALIHTDRPHLDLLPAGDLSMARRPAMARSDTLKQLIAELSTRYDHLLLDIPAVQVTSDAIALASLSDACVVVVRHGVTFTTTVQRALDAVSHLTMLGVVLNKVSIKTPRWLHTLIPQE